MDSSTLVPTSAAASTLTLLSALTPVMMLRRLGSSAKGLRSARLVNTVTVSFKSRCILALQMSLFCSPELSRLHTSKFSLTSVIDNVHMLMCMNDKFSLTSFIRWCERINKFSLTSFHCSQQYIYTADENKNNHEAPISFFHHGSRLFDERKKGAGLWSWLCFTYAI